jgi:hypothetical protein
MEKSMIRKVWDFLPQGQWQALRKVRNGPLKGMSRHDQDALLMDMAKSRVIRLIPEENQKTITAADRAAAIDVSGEMKHLAGRWSDTPPAEPKAPPANKTAKKAVKASPAKKTAAKATPVKKPAKRAPKAFPLTFLPTSVGGQSDAFYGEQRTAQVSARIEPSLKAEFTRACKAQGVSEAAAIRMGILALLGNGND